MCTPTKEGSIAYSTERITFAVRRRSAVEGVVVAWSSALVALLYRNVIAGGDRL